MRQLRGFYKSLIFLPTGNRKTITLDQIKHAVQYPNVLFVAGTFYFLFHRIGSYLT